MTAFDKGIDMKTCNKCNLSKLESEFHRDSSKKDGLVTFCKECKKKYRKKYYSENSEDAMRYSREYYKKESTENIDEVRRKGRENARKYRARNMERVRTRNAKWMLNNYRERYKKDKVFTASIIARRTLRNALRNIGKEKESSTWELLGYGKEDFIKRIEPLMQYGMSWRNFGEWHIDHIKPVSLFIAEGETDPKVINALSNLQPLWAKDNLSKGAKYDSE
jgi:hypothetical protein